MHGGTPAFKGYGGSLGTYAHRSTMPWSTVFPTPMILRDGDIISIDTEPLSTGWVGDNA